MRLKIVVTVPPENADDLRDAIAKAGAGKAGKYTHCSVSVLGTGRFVPDLDANPHIGEPGKPQQVVEERIEINCDQDIAKDVVAAIKEAHPYEEVALDIYRLLDELEL